MSWTLFLPGICRVCDRNTSPFVDRFHGWGLSSNLNLLDLFLPFNVCVCLRASLHFHDHHSSPRLASDVPKCGRQVAFRSSKMISMGPTRQCGSSPFLGAHQGAFGLDSRVQWRTTKNDELTRCENLGRTLWISGALFFSMPIHIHPRDGVGIWDRHPSTTAHWMTAK